MEPKDENSRSPCAEVSTLHCLLDNYVTIAYLRNNHYKEFL